MNFLLYNRFLVGPAGRSFGKLKYSPQSFDTRSIALLKSEAIFQSDTTPSMKSIS